MKGTTYIMYKYYRFISENEYQNLINNKKIENDKPIHVLINNPIAYLVPNTTNYKLTKTKLLNSSYKKLKLNKENFNEILIGIVADDYLIEITLPTPSTQENLGWYYWKDDIEVCIIENLIQSYSLEDVTNIFTGDFYNWTNIKEIEIND